MMKHMYKHLDKYEGSNINININMEQLAKMVVDCNYGVRRLLSEIVDYRKEQYKQKGFGEDYWGKEIEKLLEQGLY
jgi:hypothetical protein